MARMEPGVSLYSRRVLIQPRSDKLLPDWMRFVKGVPTRLEAEDGLLSSSQRSRGHGLRCARPYLTSLHS